MYANADQGEDDPDALVVEQQHLQNWDPVSFKIHIAFICLSITAVLEGLNLLHENGRPYGDLMASKLVSQLD